ncbi:MAG: hypothetical protein KGV51_04265 [Moraxellaceae bacterium]|nr:hypothetical protein [Moraxellaceae bacterium]
MITTNVDVKNKTQTVNNPPYQYSYPNYTHPTENQNVTQPLLATQSFNQSNQLNDNQTLTANPPFNFVPNINRGQASMNAKNLRTVNRNEYVSNKLPQPPLVTKSFNQPNQLNDNQTLTANPPFNSVPNVNTEQTEINRDIQNTFLQHTDLAENKDKLRQLIESKSEKELPQKLPLVNENLQSNQKELTNNQQGMIQNPKSGDVMEDNNTQQK